MVITTGYMPSIPVIHPPCDRLFNVQTGGLLAVLYGIYVYLLFGGRLYMHI